MLFEPILTEFLFCVGLRFNHFNTQTYMEIKSSYNHDLFLWGSHNKNDLMIFYAIEFRILEEGKVKNLSTNLLVKNILSSPQNAGTIKM